MNINTYFTVAYAFVFLDDDNIDESSWAYSIADTGGIIFG